MELKKISQLKLDRIIKQHQKCLNSVGTKGHQADLSFTDLSGMDLNGVNLRYANLISANLQKVDLRGANLKGADLGNADLHGANLVGADLRSANLQGVNLRSADLRGAYLVGAYLWGADLRSANLCNTNLLAANLISANLQKANLKEAEVSWVNWHETKNIKVYVAGLPSNCKNAQLTYIPSIDVATTGCWQGTWKETINKIHNVYADNTRERKAYELAIKSIQAQMDLDDKGI